jgi:GTPase
VDQTFEVRGVGSVVSGTAVSGSIAVGQHLLLGPNADGKFTNVVVSGIQRSQV